MDGDARQTLCPYKPIAESIAPRRVIIYEAGSWLRCWFMRLSRIRGQRKAPCPSPPQTNTQSVAVSPGVSPPSLCAS